MGRDLTAFDVDNKFWQSQGRRIPWQDRMALIEEQFPSTRDPEWVKILRDEDVMARVIRDILKIDQIEPGRAGPRPNLDYDRGMQSWRELTGQDYAEVPFPQAFQYLTRSQSLSTIARKTNISRSRVHQLLRGDRPPLIDDLRTIAEAYGKKPGFFLEYRAEFIIAMVASYLDATPEMTIPLFRKLVQR